eukprot:1903166-Pleurochrysis_carterae.AAC.1
MNRSQPSHRRRDASACALAEPDESVATVSLFAVCRASSGVRGDALRRPRRRPIPARRHARAARVGATHTRGARIRTRGARIRTRGARIRTPVSQALSAARARICTPAQGAHTREQATHKRRARTRARAGCASSAVLAMCAYYPSALRAHALSVARGAHILPAK